MIRSCAACGFQTKEKLSSTHVTWRTVVSRDFELTNTRWKDACLKAMDREHWKTKEEMDCLICKSQDNNNYDYNNNHNRFYKCKK